MPRTKDKPNIVFAFADQWRHSAAGYAGDPNVRTPTLDALAAQSINFTHAVSGCPVCSPARASMITGRFPDKHGVFLNDAPLSNDAVSIAQAFTDGGYDTAYIGKWHVDGPGRTAYTPPQRRQGFDFWSVFNCTHSYYQSHYYHGDCDQKLTWPGYDAYAQTDEACRYIREHRGDRPFFLMLSWGPPHDPYDQVPQDIKATYDPATFALQPNVPADHEEKARRDLHGYYTHVTALDRCVEQLMRTLDERGLRENTILVITSDHGDMLESHGHFNKQRPWDESLRIPLLVRYPARFGGAGRSVDAIINVTDFMPTLLSMSGLAIPDTVQGRDFTGYLEGGADPGEGSALYACYVPFGLWTRRHGGRECRGVRTLGHTYVRDLSGPWLLYDNEADPYQMRNLVGDTLHRPLQNEMDKLLTKKLREAGDEFLPAREYIQRWGYVVDANETIANKW